MLECNGASGSGQAELPGYTPSTEFQTSQATLSDSVWKDMLDDDSPRGHFCS